MSASTSSRSWFLPLAPYSCLLMSIACGDAGSGIGALDGTGTACDTGAPPATSGGSHGPPFEFGDGLDETGSGAGGSGTTGTAPQTLDNPTSWEFSSTYQIYYRTTTKDERSINGWHEGSLLVVDPNLLSNVTTGETNALLHIPFALTAEETPTTTLTIQEVPLALGRQDQQVPIYEARGTTVTTRRPHFFSYFLDGASPEDPGDVLVHLVAEENRGLSATIGFQDRRVAVRGPFYDAENVTLIDIEPPQGSKVLLVETTILEDPWYLVAVPNAPINLTSSQTANLPSGDSLVPSPMAIGDAARTMQCSDGLDNDPDGKADNCDYDCLAHFDYGGNDIDHIVAFEYTKNLAMLPTIEFCTCAPDSCAATLRLIGDEAAMLLNQLDPPPDPGYAANKRAPPVRMAMVGTFIHPDGCGAASTCDADETGTSCPMNYPYRETVGSPDLIRTAAWPAVTQVASGIVDEGGDVAPVSLVGTVATTYNTTDAGLGGYDPVGGFLNLGSATIRFDFNSDVAFNGQHMAHELGHCFGLQHDNAGAFPPGGMVMGLSFMAASPGAIPILGGIESGTDFIPGRSNWSIWAEEPWKATFPRPAGFGHTGCEDHSDCQTPEYPNNTCGGVMNQRFCVVQDP